MSIAFEQDRPELKTPSEVVAENNHLREAIGRMGSICGNAIKAPPAGLEVEDIVQECVIMALTDGDDPARVASRSLFFKAIDVAREHGSQANPGNWVFQKTTKELARGEKVRPSPCIGSQAAQRRAQERYAGIVPQGNIEADPRKDICGLTLDDPNVQELEAAGLRVECNIAKIMGLCEITSVGGNAERNQKIINAHLHGYSFSKIEAGMGVNRKTATSAWRSFMMQAKDYFDYIGYNGPLAEN